MVPVNSGLHARIIYLKIIRQLCPRPKSVRSIGLKERLPGAHTCLGPALGVSGAFTLHTDALLLGNMEITF
jgi:hypothetical protein